MATHLPMAALAAALVLMPALGLAQPADRLAPYANPTYGFSAGLPFDRFVPAEEETDQALTLVDTQGPGEIRVFAGAVPDGLGLSALREQLAADPRIASITYRAGGASWFVISGYFDEPDETGAPVIFYAKLMLSRDGRTFSAFEINYPERLRADYDPLVGRIEKSMTRPG